jgi:hypothetical protein
MNTIVSAFVSNVNSRYEDSLKTYYNFGKLLLQSSVPKIIFVDQPMFDLIGENYDNTTTLIVKINAHDSYLYGYADQLTNFGVHSANPAKDTLGFIFTMCNKTEWVKQAVNLNHFKTDNFMWVDFGIRYIFKNSCSDEEFVEKINRLRHKQYDNIRIGGIWNVNEKYNINIYKTIAWYFAGGVFGGNCDNLIKFAELMKEKCIHIMTVDNTIMWETNVWYLIWRENKELFDIYSCDHNASLIDCY